jgi:hypothetical protein
MMADIPASVTKPTFDVLLPGAPRQSTALGAPFRVTSVRPDAA